MLSKEGRFIPNNMLIVISSESEQTEESQQIEALFTQGLKKLHLRKPYDDKKACRQLIQDIPERFHSRISLHQYHELADEFNIGGIHLTEKFRKHLIRENQLAKKMAYWEKKNYYISSSFHSIKDIREESNRFDYVFLSPVFHSITKKGYQGKRFDVYPLASNAFIIGLGGIKANNINEALHLGYKGVAVLGAVWKTEHPVKSFKQIQRMYQKCFHS